MRLAQSYILGRMRHQTFFSLAECNAAIASCLDRMNAHVMRRLGVSRRDLFESVERPALRALPAHDYEYAEWRLARVGLDYHVEVEDFFYSVPHTFIRAEVDVRVTARTSRSSIAVGASPPTSAAMAAAGTAPIPSTCRARTAATPNGRRTASAAGREALRRRPKR